MDSLSQFVINIIRHWEQNPKASFCESEDRIFSYHDLASLMTHNLQKEISTTKTCGISENKSLLTYAQVLFCIIKNQSFTPIPTSWPQLKKNEYIKQNDLISYKWNIDFKNKDDINPFQFLINYIKTNKDTHSTAYIYTTSGSSGAPKKVHISRNNLYHFLSNLKNLIFVTPFSRISQTFDIHFDPALADLFLATMSCSQLFPLRDSDKFDLFNYIARNNLNYIALVPSLALLNIDRLNDQSNFINTNLKVTVFTGEKLTPQIVEAWNEFFPKSLIFNLYGPTEGTVWTHSYQIDNKNKYKNIPIGSPLMGILQSISSEGELHIGGPQISKGYISDSNSVCFYKDEHDRQWYKTGDLVEVNPTDENLYFKGRIDTQIKVGGQRFELGELESLIRSFDENISAQAFSLEKSGRIIGTQVIFFEKIENKLFMEMKAFLANHLTATFLPKKYFYCSERPLNSNGKLDLKKLKHLLDEGQLEEIENC